MSSGRLSGQDLSPGNLMTSDTKFRYSHHDGRKLVLESEAGHNTTILSDYIVALLPSRSSSPNQYDLAFVEVDTTSRDTKLEETAKLKFLELSDPPQHLVEEFSFEESTAWFAHRSGAQTALHVIISTGSGVRLAEVVFRNVVKPLLSFMRLWEDLDYTIHTTTSPNSITELTKSLILPRANQGNQLSIILLSGDGGIVDIVNALLDHDKPSNGYVKPNVALLPLGTGNALANSTGILRDSTVGMSTLVRGRPKELPLFRVSFSSDHDNMTTPTSNSRTAAFGAVVFSWCMHAALVADSDTPEYRKHGSARFQMAAKEALFPSDGNLPHAYKAIISVKKKSIDGSPVSWRRIDRTEHAYVLVTFVSQLEKGFVISPKSSPFNENLRLVHFGPMDGEEIMKIMEAAFHGGGHINDPRVGYEEVEAVKIVFDGREAEDRWRRVCVDGKIFTAGKWDTVEVGKWHEGVLDLVHYEK